MRNVSPASRTAAQKWAGGVVAVSGGIGMAGVSGAFGDAWDAVVDRPLSAGVLVCGLALLAFGARDDLLHVFGVLRPSRIERDILGWLNGERYTVTKKGDAPDFVYEIVDPSPGGLRYSIVMRRVAPEGIEIHSAASLSPEQGERMNGATPAELRRLRTRLAAGTTTPDMSVQFQAGAKPSEMLVAFVELLAAENLSMSTFFSGVHAVRRAVGNAMLEMDDTAATAAERAP